MRFSRLFALTAFVITALALARLAGAGSPAEAETAHTVEVGDFFYCDANVPAGACQTVINAGDTVTWQYSTGTEGHTVTECGQSCDKPTDSPLFDSQILRPGKSYSFTFDTSGTYLYHCQFHPEAMRASVVVREAPATTTPSPSPSPTEAPLITAPPSATVSASPSPSPSGVPSITLSPTRSPGSPTPVRSGASPTASASVDTGGGGGFPTWAIVLLLVVAILAAVGGFALFVIRSQR